MNDELTTLLRAFESNGWKSSTLNNDKIILWKPLRRSSEYSGVDSSGAPVCLTNQKLSLHAEIDDLDCSEYNSKHPRLQTVEFAIFGEYRNDTWTKLAIYGISWPTAVAEIGRIEQELVQSWDALCTHARKEGKSCE